MLWSTERERCSDATTEATRGAAACEADLHAGVQGGSRPAAARPAGGGGDTGGGEPRARRRRRSSSGSGSASSSRAAQVPRATESEADELSAAPAGERGAQAGARVPKKSDGVLREGVAVRYACIARHRGRVSRATHVPRARRSRPPGSTPPQRRAPSRRARADASAPRARARARMPQSDGTYGAPRIARGAHARAGLPCGRHRVARLLRARATPRRGDPAAFASRPPWPTQRTRTRRTRSRASSPWAPRPTALDRRWAADVTYLPTWAGWLYLAVVLDLASRRVDRLGDGRPRSRTSSRLRALRWRAARGGPARRAASLRSGRQYSSAAISAALAGRRAHVRA